MNRTVNNQISEILFFPSNILCLTIAGPNYTWCWMLSDFSSAKPSGRAEEKLHQAVVQHRGWPHQGEARDQSSREQEPGARAVQRRLHLHVVQVAAPPPAPSHSSLQQFLCWNSSSCGLSQRLVWRQRDLGGRRHRAEEHFRPAGQHCGHERVRCALSRTTVHRPQDPRGKDTGTPSLCVFKEIYVIGRLISDLCTLGSLVQRSLQRQQLPTRDCTKRWSCGETGMKCLLIIY